MIKFGTDGWRAIISEEFTFANVKKVAEAIALYLINHGFSDKPLIVGYDPRFLADKFALEIVKIMNQAGINCLLTERDTPTPIVAWSVKDKKAAGAVMLTASHNPAEYCGIKFIPDYAGPAGAEITNELQENSNKELVLPEAKEKGFVERFEPRERYFKYIQQFVDLAAIKSAKIKIVYDSMHGSGRGYLDHLLQNLGCQVESLHSNRDVLFGGQNPEPDDQELALLKKKVVETKSQVGLANDGDADRFGVVDEKGQFLTPNQIVPLVFEYLVTEKGYRGAVVRSVGTTHLIDKIAAAHKIKVHETPVGFKHIAKLMLEDNIIIGGEESGGLSIKGHIPEKDGLLADLLIVDMLAKRKKKLSELWTELVSKYGAVYNDKFKLKLTEEAKNKFMTKLKNQPPTEVSRFSVVQVNNLDGVKLVLSDGSWVLARPSGTEPLVRLYVESTKPENLSVIVDSIKSLL